MTVVQIGKLETFCLIAWFSANKLMFVGICQISFYCKSGVFNLVDHIAYCFISGSNFFFVSHVHYSLQQRGPTMGTCSYFLQAVNEFQKSF